MITIYPAGRHRPEALEDTARQALEALHQALQKLEQIERQPPEQAILAELQAALHERSARH